jgi:hypothetical protein
VQILNRVEEQRDLIDLEFNLRIKLKIHIKNLSTIMEEKWQQRTSIRWSQLGDSNSAYSHAMATHRRKANYITQIEDPSNPGNLITDKATIHQQFDSYYKELLGTRPDDDRASHS